MISIIIINYYQKKFLRDCIDSIYRNIKSCEFEVIIVNNSPDEDLSDIEAVFRNIVILKNTNLGFSQANNLGVRSSIGDYLFFLNPDTVLNGDIFRDIFTDFGVKKFGAVGFRLIYPDGIFQISFGLDINLKNEKTNKDREYRFNTRDIGFIDKVVSEYLTVKEVNWVSGAAMLVRRVVYLEVGGFDEKYFLYYEDADLCRRFRNAGYKNYFYPHSEIVHYKGENTNYKFKDDTHIFSKISQLIYYGKHNSVAQNVFLRMYLFVKFAIRYFLSFRKVNLEIISLLFKRP